jgi:prevent-host-death family protein
MTVGIRELKNNLSEYLRAVQRGRRITVTSHGRAIAELAPPQPRRGKARKKRLTPWERLVAKGAVHPATEDGNPFEGVDLKPLTPPGSGLEFLEWSRGED